MIERSRPGPPRSARAVLPFALFALYLPLLMMVASSFVDDSSPSLRWYDELFHDPVLWGALARSAMVASISALVATALALLGSLALERWIFLGKWPLRTLSTLSLMLPELVLSLSLLSWFATLGVELGLTTVIAAHVTLTLPFAILVIGARLTSLDRSIEDAARDLGARESQVLMRITLPLLGPALLSAFLLSFLLSFDDFLVTFYTNGAGGDTLPVKLYSMMKTGISPKVQALASFMLVGSVVLVTALARLQLRQAKS